MCLHVLLWSVSGFYSSCLYFALLGPNFVELWRFSFVFCMFSDLDFQLKFYQSSLFVQFVCLGSYLNNLTTCDCALWEVLPQIHFTYYILAFNITVLQHMSDCGRTCAASGEVSCKRLLLGFIGSWTVAQLQYTVKFAVKYFLVFFFFLPFKKRVKENFWQSFFLFFFF